MRKHRTHDQGLDVPGTQWPYTPRLPQRWHSVTLWPPATVQATASLSPSNPSSTSRPLCPRHVGGAPGPRPGSGSAVAAPPAPPLGAAGRLPAGSPARRPAGPGRSSRALWEGTAAPASAGAGSCECWQIYPATVNVLLPSTRPPRLHYWPPLPLAARCKMTGQRCPADARAARLPRELCRVPEPSRERARARKPAGPESLRKKLPVGASTVCAPPCVLSAVRENRGPAGAEGARTSLRRLGGPSRSLGPRGRGQP